MALMPSPFLQCTPSRAEAQETAEAIPGPPIPLERVPVQDIRFEGNTVVSDEELRAAAAIAPGQVTSPALLQEARRRIESLYGDRGYVAEVTRIEILGEEPRRTLAVGIRETRVAELRLEGLRRTRENAIRRLLEVSAGAVLNRAALQRDLTRLNELDIFAQVELLLQETAELGAVTVIWEFKEAKTREITLGGSSMPGGQLVAEVRFIERNLFGRAQQLSASVNTGTIEGGIGGQVAYFNPLISEPRTSLFARAYSDVISRFTRDLLDDPDIGRYFERHTGAQAIVNRPAGPDRSLSYGLRYESTDVQNLPSELLAAATSADGRILVSSTRFVEDRRLFLVLPASGNYFAASVEAGQADLDLSGTNTIAKLQADRRWYLSLQKITPEALAAGSTTPVRSAAIRLNAGTSLGDIPFFEQFFLGGANDLRGYRESRFWGKHLFVLNAELRWPLSRSLVGVAFFDVGDAWGSDFQFPGEVSTPFSQHRNFSPKAGAGLGLWWVTKLGVIRLEFARGEANRVHFLVGESF